MVLLLVTVQLLVLVSFLVLLWLALKPELVALNHGLDIAGSKYELRTHIHEKCSPILQARFSPVSRLLPNNCNYNCDHTGPKHQICEGKERHVFATFPEDGEIQLETKVKEDLKVESCEAEVAIRSENSENSITWGKPETFLSTAKVTGGKKNIFRTT